MSLDLASLLRPERAEMPLPNNANIAPVERRPDFQDSINNSATKRRNKRCEVLRFARVEDETGGSTPAWKQAGGYFVGIESSGQPTENTVQGTDALRSKFPFTIFFPLDADITAKDRIGIPGWFNIWKPLQDRGEGEVIIPSATGGNGRFYVLVTPGRSGMEEPNWLVTPGAYVADGTALWKEAGEANFYEVEATNRGDGSSAELLAYCNRVE